MALAVPARCLVAILLVVLQLQAWRVVAVDVEVDMQPHSMPARNASQAQMYREGTARVLEATHGWLNCLLSARPRPSPEIVTCTEMALPLVTDIVTALTTAGWAIHFGSQTEAEDIGKAMVRMSEVRSQVQSCVETLNVSVQVAGRCFTVM